MSDSDSSYISSDTVSSSADSFEYNEGITGMYECEPQYNDEELKKLPEENSEIDTSDNEGDSSRLENLHWCSCENCVIGWSMRLEEVKCCRECNILSEKL